MRDLRKKQSLEYADYELHNCRNKTADACENSYEKEDNAKQCWNQGGEEGNDDSDNHQNDSAEDLINTKAEIGRLAAGEH